MRQQPFDRGRVLRRTAFDAEDVLAAAGVHTDSAEDVVFAKALAVDVDDKDFHLVPSTLLQLLQLLGAGLRRLPADRAAGYAHGGGHRRQHIVVLPR